jgi:hypothetical protein
MVVMPYPAKVTLEISAQRLAKRDANVPAGDQQEFCDRAIKLVFDLRKHPSTAGNPGKRLIEAAKAARCLTKNSLP